MRKNTLNLALASGLAGLALFTAGCSGSSDGGKKQEDAGSDSSGSGEDAAMDKAQKLRSCLREKGMDVPDVKPGSNPNAEILAAPEGVSAQKWEKALDECGSGVKGGGGGAAGEKQDMDQQVKVAECVRNKGFDMPDPKPAPDGMNNGFKIPQGADPEKFMKALNECTS